MKTITAILILALLSGCAKPEARNESTQTIRRANDYGVASYVIDGEIIESSGDSIIIKPIEYLKGRDLPERARLFHFKLGRDTPLRDGIKYSDAVPGRRLLFYISESMDLNRKY